MQGKLLKTIQKNCSKKFNNKDSFKDLTESLRKEINYESGSQLSLPKIEKYFKKNEWKINFLKDNNIKLQKVIEKNLAEIIFQPRTYKPDISEFDHLFFELQKENKFDHLDENTQIDDAITKNYLLSPDSQKYVLPIGVYIIKKDLTLFGDYMLINKDIALNTLCMLETDEVKGHQKQYLIDRTDVRFDTKEDMIGQDLFFEINKFIRQIGINTEFIKYITSLSQYKERYE